MSRPVVTGGLSAFADNFHVRKGSSHRSSMAAGLWFGVILSGRLETEDEVFGRRAWNGASATMFWNGQEKPNDHYFLEDGQVSSLFVHLAPEALNLFGLPAQVVQAGYQRMLTGSNARLARLLPLAGRAVACADGASGQQRTIVAAAHHVMLELLEDAGLWHGTDEGHCALSAAEIERFYLARDLLLADLRNPPGIGELARTIGTNPRKLTDGFRALFGQTPFAMLKSYRLEQALEALKRERRPIAEIASEIGYRPAHLSAVFRQRYGFAPSMLRAGGASSM